MPPGILSWLLVFIITKYLMPNVSTFPTYRVGIIMILIAIKMVEGTGKTFKETAELTAVPIEMILKGRCVFFSSHV